MMPERTVNISMNINRLQFHYWFADKSHTMDALVLNKCERELLELTKVVASICGVSIKMETEPTSRGGLKGWLTILPKSEKKTKPYRVATVTTLLAATIITPLGESIGNKTSAFIDQVADALIADSENSEELQNEIAKLRAEIGARIQLIDQSNTTRKRRSNFYDLLRKYLKVKKFSVVLERASKKPVINEEIISREEFQRYILVTDQLQPEVLDNVAVEIISPVLGKGKFKWKGMYEGAPISFSMKSDEFISLVQSGKVEFKNGTTINCRLEIEKKINSAGIERITSYNIVHVNSYQESGKAVETTEGKQQRQKQEVAKKQLSLF